MKQYEQELGVNITFSVEAEPLGTGIKQLFERIIINHFSWSTGFG
jgi:hypothetical protein